MARGATVKRLERKMEVLLKRTDELRVALEQFGDTTQRGLALVRAGDVSLVEGLTATRAGKARERLNKALDQMEAARREVRVAMSDVAVEEGASLSELARALGVSRQLLSRLAISSRAEQP
jgi:anti-anti-sigma regulatory factor